MAHRQHAVEVRAYQLALADLFRGDLGLLGDHAGGELLGRHLEREETDHGAVGHLGLAVLAVFLAIGLGGIEADVGGERAFAHRRPARQDDQVRPVQAAQQLVELEQARGDAGELAGPVIGRFGGDRGLGKGGAERPEAAFGLAGAGEVVELLFRTLDLRQRGVLDVAAEGAVHHAFAEIDELPAEIEIVHRPAERAGIDDMHRGRRQARQVGAAAGRLHVLVLLDIGLERDGAHHLAALDQPRQRAEQLAVQGIGEMLRAQELGHPLVGGVVDQDGAQQRLLRLEIVRRLAQADVFGAGQARDVGRVFQGLHAEPLLRTRGVVHHRKNGGVPTIA